MEKQKITKRAQRYYPDLHPQNVRTTKTQKISRLSLKEKEETASFRRKKPRHEAGFKNGYVKAASDLLYFLKKSVNKNQTVDLARLEKWIHNLNEWRGTYDDTPPPKIV